MSSTGSDNSTPSSTTDQSFVKSNLQFVRAEDFVEYFIFPANQKEGDPSKELQNLLQKIHSQLSSHVRDYIWHKDEFNLSVRTEAQQTLIEEENNKQLYPLPPHLHGITHYGDNIQDEWFIVYLLYELTRENPGIVARVLDSDGEFLMIEAADFLPNWANPDTCEQRVYISGGYLHLIQDSTSFTPSVEEALTKIARNPTIHRVSNDIEHCIQERLKEFAPEVRGQLTHIQIVRLPMGVASILKEHPSLIAPACRAFCERDAIDMKACRAMRFFPPEDRVRTPVKFTRCLYAMLTHAKFVPDRRTGWNLPGATCTEEYKEDLLGVKVACGFEILASQVKDKEGFDSDPAWRIYQKSLMNKGYFKNNLEGTQEYNQLLEDAKEFFKTNREKFRTRAVVGKEIIDMLHSLDTTTFDQLREEENNLPPSDSDDWLNISPGDLDAMLTQKYGMKNLYFSRDEINAKEFTSNIAEFLDRKSEFDGIDDDVPTPTSRKANIKKNASMRKAVNDHPIVSKSPDQSVSFDPDSFSTHVKSFLDFVIPEDTWESNSEMSDYEDDDDIEKNIEEMTNSEMNIDSDIKAYMDQMDKELAKTAVGKSFEKSSKSATEDDFDDIESFQPIDIDVNTLKNMVHSYKSQMGSSGPASNLLNTMGMNIENVDNAKLDLPITESTV